MKASELGGHCARFPHGNAPGGNRILIASFRPAQEFVVDRSSCAHRLR